MTNWRTGFVLGCCLLTAVGALSADRCSAAPPQKNSSTEPSVAKDDSTEKPTRLGNPVSLPADPTPTPTDYDNSLGLNLLKNITLDQKAIWTSPARIRAKDASWLVPFGGITAGLIATDRDVSLHMSQDPATLNHYDNLSNYLLGSMVAGGGGLFLWGHITHNDHEREAGLLSGEAAINSLGVTTAIKYATGRERPFQGDHNGNFWSGGDSFPSDHSAVAWSIASVLTHEYPGPLTQILAYGAATAVSYARVRAQQHFSSDVFVGAGIGWLIGWQVYRAHHNPDLGGGTWRSLSETLVGDRPYQAKNMGSPYVLLDSWVYPAMDRLIALGYIRTAMLGMRPWTRIECARLVTEAGDELEGDAGAPDGAEDAYVALAREFSSEIKLLGGGSNRSAQVESVYTRLMDVSGMPLSQGYQYDFGQTIINDYGRPYEEGFNNVTGISGWADEGPFTVYVRGEYQYAPSASALPDAVRQEIGVVNRTPPPPPTPFATTSRFRLLDAYVGMNLGNWQMTFGKQSLWWGPGDGGAMLWSTNAEPINMFRISRVTPFRLPSIFGFMGPIRVEFFLGQLDGHYFVKGMGGTTGSWTEPLLLQPFIHGEKLSFKPTPNLEFGFFRTSIFSGTGVPFTPHTFWKSLVGSGNGAPGSPQDPGDRRSGFDVTYRLPKLRDRVTLYGDGFSDDEFSPVAYWDQSAWNAGLYFPRLPKVPRLDLRVEGVFTDLPIGGYLGHGFFYWNDRYINGYTNHGYLLGSWIGRQGQGAQAWTTYWFTPKDKLQFSFRHEKVSKEFITNGGTITDEGVRGEFWIHSSVSVVASVQHETWDFPIISSETQSNVTASVTLAFWPFSHRAGAGGGQ
jgi:membrane-associated phospholipid phosphatase